MSEPPLYNAVGPSHLERSLCSLVRRPDLVFKVWGLG